MVIPEMMTTQMLTSAIAWSFSSWLCSCSFMWASLSSSSSCTASTVESAFKWQRTKDPRPISAWLNDSWNSMTRSRVQVDLYNLHPIRNPLLTQTAEGSNHQTKRFQSIPCLATTRACTTATASSWSKAQKRGIVSSSKITISTFLVVSRTISVYLVLACAHQATRTRMVWWLIWATLRTAWTTLTPRLIGASRVTWGRRRWRSTRIS